jgi:hypothetical protein
MKRRRLQISVKRSDDSTILRGKSCIETEITRQCGTQSKRSVMPVQTGTHDK